MTEIAYTVLPQISNDVNSLKVFYGHCHTQRFTNPFLGFKVKKQLALVKFTLLEAASPIKINITQQVFPALLCAITEPLAQPWAQSSCNTVFFNLFCLTVPIMGYFSVWRHF